MKTAAADEGDMDLNAIGQVGFSRALERFDSSAKKLVEDGADVDAVAGLLGARSDARIAAELIRRGDELDSTLLDILA